MRLPRPDSSPRRLGLLSVVLVVPLVAAAGVAWACVPTARTAVNPVSGPPGKQVTMTGDGFPDSALTADIYLDTRTSGSPIKQGVPMTANSSGERAFSTQLTMPTTVGAHLLIPVPRNSTGNDVGTLSSGAGPPAAVFQVTAPALSTTPGAGSAGSTVTVSGAEFRSGTVRLRWDSPDGPELGSAVATGAHFTFAKDVTIPDSAVGDHSIVGVPLGDPTDTASAAFRVLPAATAAPGDSVGPAIVAAALASGNGTRTVSKKGDVTILCGQFDEPGVTGRCGARSVKKLKAAGASRSALLKLPAKSFHAEQGKPVKLKFRLKKASMRMLKAAKKVRMRGTVSARDSKGNASPAVSFGFTLKARR